MPNKELRRLPNRLTLLRPVQKLPGKHSPRRYYPAKSLRPPYWTRLHRRLISQRYHWPRLYSLPYSPLFPPMCHEARLYLLLPPRTQTQHLQGQNQPSSPRLLRLMRQYLPPSFRMFHWPGQYPLRALSAFLFPHSLLQEYLPACMPACMPAFRLSQSRKTALQPDFPLFPPRQPLRCSQRMPPPEFFSRSSPGCSRSPS